MQKCLHTLSQAAECLIILGALYKALLRFGVAGGALPPSTWTHAGGPLPHGTASVVDLMAGEGQKFTWADIKASHTCRDKKTSMHVCLPRLCVAAGSLLPALLPRVSMLVRCILAAAWHNAAITVWVTQRNRSDSPLPPGWAPSPSETRGMLREVLESLGLMGAVPRSGVWHPLPAPADARLRSDLAAGLARALSIHTCVSPYRRTDGSPLEPSDPVLCGPPALYSLFDMSAAAGTLFCRSAAPYSRPSARVRHSSTPKPPIPPSWEVWVTDTLAAALGPSDRWGYTNAVGARMDPDRPIPTLEEAAFGDHPVASHFGQVVAATVAAALSTGGGIVTPLAYGAHPQGTCLSAASWAALIREGAEAYTPSVHTTREQASLLEWAPPLTSYPLATGVALAQRRKGPLADRAQALPPSLNAAYRVISSYAAHCRHTRGRLTLERGAGPSPLTWNTPVFTALGQLLPPVTLAAHAAAAAAAGRVCQLWHHCLDLGVMVGDVKEMIQQVDPRMSVGHPSGESRLSREGSV